MSFKLPNISYSALSTFSECPQKFYRFYVLKEGKNVETDSYHAFLGTVIQAILENIVNDRLYKTQDINSLCEGVKAEILEHTVNLVYPVGTFGKSNIKPENLNWCNGECEKSKYEKFHNDIGG